MKQNDVEHETWLDLSQAADYLGVHFTTLRRWADAGQIEFIRTPGGRRRFAVKALAQFVQAMAQSSAAGLAAQSDQALNTRAIDYARQSVRSLSSKASWMSRMTDEQRSHLRGTGHQLMALLLQYNSRAEGGEAFMDEGQRMMMSYSQACAQIGLSLTETVHIFLTFRRSILDAVHQTGYLGGRDDFEGQRLYSRTSDFLDALLISLIDSYIQPQNHISE